jgi:glucose-1-phosphate thymidylyltransferase
MSMWGIIPAAGQGSRIQPLAFSKELLPVGSRINQDDERPKAVSEYIVERMLRAGADRLCFVIAPGKSDIVKYYGSGWDDAQVCYVVQPAANGLCDAIFRALPLVRSDEPVLVGLPDTVWFPEHGFTELDLSCLSFLLFPVDHPEHFDAVVTDDDGTVREIQVKQRDATSHWIWGAFAMPGAVLGELHELWLSRGRSDAYMGTLVNEYIARGGKALGVKTGSAYFDVGTLDGYRRTMALLGAASPVAEGARADHARTAGERP